MARFASLLTVIAFFLSACAPTSGTSPGNGVKVYKISARDSAKIQYRTLDSINSARAASGMTPLTLDSKLNAAAATHSRDMSVQNRPWHFGSDGSSPIDRVARTGYSGLMLGENISETYESEVETLSAWMSESDTRGVIMDPNAVNLGFSWYQEPNGKIWWTLLTGS